MAFLPIASHLCFHVVILQSKIIWEDKATLCVRIVWWENWYWIGLQSCCSPAIPMLGIPLRVSEKGAEWFSLPRTITLETPHSWKDEVYGLSLTCASGMLLFSTQPTIVPLGLKDIGSCKFKQQFTSSGLTPFYHHSAVLLPLKNPRPSNCSITALLLHPSRWVCLVAVLSEHFLPFFLKLWWTSHLLFQQLCPRSCSLALFDNPPAIPGDVESEPHRSCIGNNAS